MLEALGLPAFSFEFPGLQHGPGMYVALTSDFSSPFPPQLSGLTQCGCSSSAPNPILEHPPSGLCIAPPLGTRSPSLGSPWRSCAGVTHPVEQLLGVPHPGSPPRKWRLLPGLLGTPCYFCWGPGFSRGLREQRGPQEGPRLVGVGCKANKGMSTHRMGTQDLQN